VDPIDVDAICHLIRLAVENGPEIRRRLDRVGTGPQAAPGARVSVPPAAEEV
jgi:hypothetical protein